MDYESLIKEKLQKVGDISISATFYGKGVDYSVSVGGEKGEEADEIQELIIDWSDDLLQYLIGESIFYNWDASLYLNSGNIQISISFSGPFDDEQNQALVFEDNFIEDLNELNKEGVVVECESLFVDFWYSIERGFTDFKVHEYLLNEEQIEKIQVEILDQMNSKYLQIEDMYDCVASLDMQCTYNEVCITSELGPANISWDEIYSKKNR